MTVSLKFPDFPFPIFKMAAGQVVLATSSDTRFNPNNVLNDDPR
jgi:hypothetical protein